jgi:hypothetical protein
MGTKLGYGLRYKKWIGLEFIVDWTGIGLTN